MRWRNSCSSSCVKECRDVVCPASYYSICAGERWAHMESRQPLAYASQSPTLNCFQMLCTSPATGYVAACAAQSSPVPGGSVALSTAAANAAAADSIRPFIQQAWSFCTTGQWSAQRVERPVNGLAPDIEAFSSKTFPPSIYEPQSSSFDGHLARWDGLYPW